jgi:uncharacterized lipoprotein YajG
MEHRWSDRIFSSFDVLLFNNNIPVVECKASNIGLYGMFVKTGPVRYARNSVLDVEIVTDAKKHPKKYRLPAYVVHQSKEGLGLAFKDDNPDVIGVIKNLIRNVSNNRSPGNLIRGNEELINKKSVAN